MSDEKTQNVEGIEIPTEEQISEPLEAETEESTVTELANDASAEIVEEVTDQDPEVSSEKKKTPAKKEKKVEAVKEEPAEAKAEESMVAELGDEASAEIVEEVTHQDPEVSSEKKKTPAKKEKKVEAVKEEPAEDLEQASPKKAEKQGSVEHSSTEEEEEEEEEEEVTSSDDHDHDEDHIEEKAQKDYHSLSQKELITELQEVLKTTSIQKIKHDVEEIRAEFNAKFQHELEHEKVKFLAKGGNIIDFHYSTPSRKEFNSLYFDYKEKRNHHYKNLKKDLQANFVRRNELIEELKGLLNAEENINTTYKHFKEIQEKWRVAGAIPRDKYNMVWNTYHHHVENFYDFLHLNREFRDLDFKHNLEQKLKLIARAEELSQEADINRAFRELQMLHKMWKEDVGPVAKEYRDDVWDKFSEATKLIHDKRFENLKELEAEYEEHYNTKKELIAQINEVTETAKPSHQGWQNAIKKVQELRDLYFNTGKVPRAKNKEIWNEFKEVTRHFNHEKNDFYKGQKKEQYTNLEKKRELIKIAEENKDSEDFEAVTPLMKKIQSDWRTIGHVPRRDSDKIWKKFKATCNHYFDRLHALKNEANKEELVHFDAKKALMEGLTSFELTGDQKTDIVAIKAKIKEWKEIGRVPFNKKKIEQQFNKMIDDLFSKLDLGKKETELIKFENKLNTMVSQEDDRKLQNEQFFISKKIEESKNEIRQLENNLGFFKHVDENNPMVKEVHNNIKRHKEQLEVWSAKLSKIRTARK